MVKPVAWDILSARHPVNQLRSSTASKTNVIAARQITRPLKTVGLREHYDLIVGNLFEPILVDTNIDCVRDLIHDWDENKSLTILWNWHEAMTRVSRFLIWESVIPPENPSFGESHRRHRTGASHARQVS